MNNLKIDLIKLYDNYEINNKTIFIFEGFPYDYLKNLSSKFFDKDYKDIFKINENYNAEYILSQVFERKHSNDKKFWMTAEEYSAVKSIDSLIIELFDFVVIKNNLFNKIYPYYNTMQNIKEMYEKFFYNVSDIIDEDDEKIYEVVSSFMEI